jgi:hypothetical protein
MANVTFAEKTQVVIVGTIHSSHLENPNYTPDMLKEIISSLKPDVILNELPLNQVESDGRPLKGFRKKDNPSGPECWAADTVATQLGIKQIPFDISNRYQFLMETKYFEIQERVDKLYEEWCEDLEENGSDSDTLATNIMRLWSNCYQSEAFLFYNSGPKLINSDAHDSIIRNKTLIWYEVMPIILEKYPSYKSLLEDYKSQKSSWLERNKIMADNIVNAAKQYSGKRVVVVTGATHRYILRDLLEKQNFIDLKEYWEIAEPGH